MLVTIALFALAWQNIQTHDDKLSAEIAHYAELPATAYRQEIAPADMTTHFTVVAYRSRNTGRVRTFLEGELRYKTVRGLGLDDNPIRVASATALGGSSLLMENEPVIIGSCGSPSRAPQVTFCNVEEKIAILLPDLGSTGKLQIQFKGNGAYRGYVDLDNSLIQRVRRSK